MTTATRTYTTAEYTCDSTWGKDAGRVLTGDVVQLGKTYADVQWRESGRVERVRFRDARGVVLKP